jgi:hypothetical protein
MGAKWMNVFSMKRTLSAVLVACLWSSVAFAYDNQLVHRAMTRAAFDRANAESRFLAQLGLTETQILIGGLSARECAVEGAFAEDGGVNVQYHFLDPVNVRPLTVFPVSAFPSSSCSPPVFVGPYTAQTWALSANENPFNLLRAKERMWGAYLLPKPNDRAADAAALFTDLGHVVHLIQDMAQPQHVRNDTHLTLEGFGFPGSPEYTWSRYEMWCQLNASGAAFYQGYPAVDLDDERSYWNAGDGRGLAEYANRNFVTEHTNYSDKLCAPFNYADPLLSAATPRDETHIVTTYTWDEANATLQVKTGTYEDTVYTFPTFDRYLDQFTSNEQHTYYSYFDYELKKKEGERLYSLPEVALHRQASLLIPRAVGYSTGFLKHFFRGKIDAKWKKNADGTYDLTIINLSDEPIENAKVELSYRVPAGTHGAAPEEDLVPVELPSSLSSSIDIAAGDSWTVFGITNVNGLTDSESLLSFEKRIVLTGFLGNEQGAVVGLIQPPQGSLKVEFSAGCAVISGQGRAEWVLLSANKSATGDFRVIRLPLASAQSSLCSALIGEERLCIEKHPSSNGVSATLTVSPYEKNRAYRTGLNGVFPVGCIVTEVHYFDGTKVFTRSQPVQGSGEWGFGTLFYPFNPAACSDEGFVCE